MSSFEQFWRKTRDSSSISSQNLLSRESLELRSPDYNDHEPEMAPLNARLIAGRIE
jgi:hypothetical protein